MYKYDAKVIKVVDGDTIDVEIDLGFKIYISQRCRLEGINTPESRSKNKDEKELGLKVKQYLIEQLINKTVLVETEKQGKFGRYLAKIWLYKDFDKDILEDKSLNQELIDKGYAIEYHGGKKVEFKKSDYNIKE